jgi:hypothetical protein
MSNHELTRRTDRLIAVLSAVAFFTLLAIAQHQDATDDAAARAHVQQQARGDAK